MFSIVNIKMSQAKKGQNILSLIKLSVLSGLFLCGCFFLTIGFTLLQRTVIHGERSYVLAGCSPSGKYLLFFFKWRFTFFFFNIHDMLI